MEGEKGAAAPLEKDVKKAVSGIVNTAFFLELGLLAAFLAAAGLMESHIRLWGFLYGLLTLAVFLAGYFLVSRKMNRTLALLDDTIDSLINGQKAEYFSGKKDDLLGKFQSQITKLYEILEAHGEREKQLREQVSALIADLVHQINTPITNISLYSSLLEGETGEEERRQFLACLKGQVEKMKWFGQGFDKVARLEMDMIRLEVKKQPVLPVLLGAVDEVSLRAKEKGISVVLQGERDIFVYCDRKWTEEAVFNLLDNGVKYAARKGELLVRITPLELFARIDVEDLSEPIPREEYHAVFQRFYRGKNAAMVQEGVGLGLFLARQIVTEEGGYVQVEESKREGGGNRFSLFLRLWEKEENDGIFNQ